MAVLADAAPVRRAGVARRGLPRAAAARRGDARPRSSGSPPRCGPTSRSVTGLPASVGAGLGQAARQDRVGAGEARRAARRRPGRRARRARPAAGPVRCGASARWRRRRCSGRVCTRSASWPRLDLREAARLLGGAVGTELHRLARGVDDRPVAPRGRGQAGERRDHVRRRPHGDEAVHDAVARLAEAAHRRLLAVGARGPHRHGQGPQRRLHHRHPLGDRRRGQHRPRRAHGHRPAPGPRGRARRRRTAARRVARRARRRAAARAVRPSRRPDPPPHAVRTGGARPRRARPSCRGRGAPATTSHHPEHGHGWVQGAGHGRVTVRFETRSSGPGRALTVAADDPALRRADPLACLA